MSALPTAPALVVGAIMHRRAGQLRHGFRHRLYLWLIDLDDVPVQPWYLRPLGAFSSADHLGDPRLPIKQNVEQHLADNGIRLGDGGRILMLANGRVFGHVFDPLTVYWCFQGDGALACAIAEVRNTYGQRHLYLLRPDARGVARADKAFFVSPFLDVSGSYVMRLSLRPDAVSITVALRRSGALAYSASFRGVPRPASRSAILAQFIRQPFIPQRVSVLIRLHGIWLWLRRAPMAPRPPRTAKENS